MAFRTESEQLYKAAKEKRREAEALIAGVDDGSAEDTPELRTKIKGLIAGAADDETAGAAAKAEEEEFERARSANAAAVKNYSGHGARNPAKALGAGSQPDDGAPGDARTKAFELARVNSRVQLKAFAGEDGHREAYNFAQTLRAGIFDVESAKRYCKDAGLPIKFEREGDNTAGGALVVTEFQPTLIVLLEKYGVFRREARNWPMGSDSLNVPKQAGELVAVGAAEGEGTSDQQLDFNLIELTARKAKIRVFVSEELSEDSAIAVADVIMMDMARGMAKYEDRCGFVGTGTSVYNKITGVTAKLRAVDATVANIAGLILGSGNLWSELKLEDFQAVAGALPEYAEDGAKWFCHKAFYETVMLKLALAAGGVTAADIVQGGRVRRFLGYDVAATQVMPRKEANSQIPAVLANLQLGAGFGNRRGLTVRQSLDEKFSDDLIVIKATERFDENVFGVGGLTEAAGGTGDAGPICGLITAAS